MLLEYLDCALRRATYDKLDDGGTFVGEVPGLQGVLAHGETLESCRDQLAEVIEGWVLFRIANGMDVPELDGRSVTVSHVS